MRRLLAFEKRDEPLAPRQIFLGRLGRNAGYALVVVMASLLIGTLGYIIFEEMAPIDAFANAAMILSGMGPLGILNTTAGKLFASFYAIASGLLLFVIAGLMLLPIYHRILHRFHIEDEEPPPPTPRGR